MTISIRTTIILHPCLSYDYLHTHHYHITPMTISTPMTITWLCLHLWLSPYAPLSRKLHTTSPEVWYPAPSMVWYPTPSMSSSEVWYPTPSIQLYLPRCMHAPASIQLHISHSKHCIYRTHVSSSIHRTQYTDAQSCLAKPSTAAACHLCGRAGVAIVMPKQAT